ncbi:MAG TPA: hypothetical protein VME69_00315 [Methylocella sp.]|nr:hypothetical protein [Methylocella sp.]
MLALDVAPMTCRSGAAGSLPALTICQDRFPEIGFSDIKDYQKAAD